MKPCVMHDSIERPPARLQIAHPGAKSQVADRRLALCVGAGALLGAQHRARIHPGGARCPARSRNAAPSVVASSSPMAMTRARARIVDGAACSRHLRRPARAVPAMKRSNCAFGRDAKPLGQIAVHASRCARARRCACRSAAAASSDSSRSVIPESAECTTTGRRPSAMRSRSTRAMLCQLAAVDTLVPPNLSTTQLGSFLAR